MTIRTFLSYYTCMNTSSVTKHIWITGLGALSFLVFTILFILGQEDSIVGVLCGIAVIGSIPSCFTLFHPNNDHH